MKRTIVTRVSTLVLTALFVCLSAGRAQGQEGGNPWKQVQDILKVEFPENWFYPKEGTAFGSMPYNLLGQFFYGDEDGRVSLALPLWVSKPNKGQDWYAVVRSGGITKEYYEYPVEFSLYRLGPNQTAREEIEKRAARVAYMAKPDREWKLNVIRNNHIYYNESIKGPFAFQRKEVTYYKCPGYRIQLYAKYDIFELQGVYKDRNNSLDDIHKKVRWPTNMQTFAGFEFTVSDNERYCVLCTTGQRNNIHGDIPYASGYALDNMLTTIAKTLADVFGKEAELNRELSEAEYSGVKKQWADLASRAAAHFLVSEFRQGYVGIAIAATGEVVHDPGRGKPEKMVRGTKVRIGDWIRTGSNGRVRIEMFDRDEPNNAGPSVVNIATDSELFIGSFLYSFDDTGEQKSMIELIRGTIREIFSGWGPSSVFSVKAGVAICGIRGSDVMISHDPAGKTVNAYVIDGHMDVRNSRTGDVRSLAANQQLTVNNGNLGEVTSMSRSVWDRLVSRQGLDVGQSGAAGVPKGEYSITLKLDSRAAWASGTRAIRLSAQGAVAQLERNRDNYTIRVTFARNGERLMDRDGTYCTDEGEVVNHFALADRSVKIDGNKFSVIFHTPLNDLDLTADTDLSLTIHTALMENGRVVAAADPVPLTIERSLVPRVWFSNAEVAPEVTGPGQYAIRARADVSVSQLIREDVRFEMTLMTDAFQKISVNDPTFRMGDGHAGAARTVPGTQAVRIGHVDLTLPQQVLRLAAGEHALYVHLRAVNTQGRAVGISRPFPVTVTLSKGQGAYDIPAIKADFAGMRFYERGNDLIPFGERTYAAQFSAAGARRICWELELEHPKPGTNVDLTIEAAWYRPDGSSYGSYTKKCTIQSEWDGSYHTSDLGWDDPGHWEPGKYRVDLIIAGEKIATGFFEIVN